MYFATLIVENSTYRAVDCGSHGFAFFAEFSGFAPPADASCFYPAARDRENG
jgi:hypothetical protein